MNATELQNLPTGTKLSYTHSNGIERGSIQKNDNGTWTFLTATFRKGKWIGPKRSGEVNSETLAIAIQTGYKIS